MTTAAYIEKFETLQQENLSLKTQVAKQNQELAQRDEKIIHLEEQLTWFKRQLFGKKSERDVSHLDAQQLQFEGFEQSAEDHEQTKTVGAHTRREPKKKGTEAIVLPKDLPVETQVIDIPEDQKICKETGVSLVKIGEERSYKLAYKPGSFYLKEIIRPKYVHPQQEDKGITTAELPGALLPKCQADDSFLAFVLTKKFTDHLPLYRTCEGLLRHGIRISRKLLSQWVIKCGKALKPLYNEMIKQILQSKSLYIDESPVKLQDIEKCKTAYMWVVVGGQGADPPYRIYNFRENRCHDHALEILSDYHDIVHSDKYGAYERLAQQKKIIWCPCFAHIRRKFFEAETGDPRFRDWVLRKIKYLFMLERIAWAHPAEKRLQIRQEKEVPIIDELIQVIKQKLTDGKILPKSKLREAMSYFCGLIPYLKNYTKHAEARIDNNIAERAIRPLAIGRKNWLFFGSVDGGEAGAVILSLVQTCRGLRINPEEYLEDVMRRLMSHSAQKLYELLPDQWSQSRKAASCT
jgi:transposase